MAKTRKDVLKRQETTDKYGLKRYEYPDGARTYNELRKEYMQLADIADRRMRRLEEYASKDDKYENILKFAYDRAIGDIQAETGYNTYRFKQGVPKEGNIMNLQSRINDVLKFLNSPTSTISGVKKVYRERAKVINQKYGMNLTWENMADFFENDVFLELKANFASDTAMKIIGKYFRNEDEIKEIFGQYEKENASNIKSFSSSQTDTRLTAKQMRYLFKNREKLGEVTKKMK